MNENIHAVGVLEPASSTQVKAQPTPSKLDNSAVPEQVGIFSWLRRGAPTLLVLALLAGVAWFGHHFEWKLPAFAELLGKANKEKDDWCEEHGVPESICVECNESLLAKAGSSWCREHGVHVCLFEHPDAAQSATPPVFTKADRENAATALALKDRPGNNSRCKTHLKRVQLASTAVETKMGLDIHQVKPGAIEETVTASGEIVYEEPRVANLASPVPGRVWFVTEQGRLGEQVKRGDVLALVDAVEIGKAKAEFLQAQAQLDLRTKTLENLKPAVAQGAIPLARQAEAETAQTEARIRLLAAQQALANMGLTVNLDAVKNLSAEELNRYLQFLGIPESMRKRLDGATATANLFPILASRDGVVILAKAVPGEGVDPAKNLFTIADTSRMWLHLNVRNEDVKYLKIRDPKTGAAGQAVRFRPDGADQDVLGELIFRTTQVDEKTRTVQFRAEVANPGGTLLANSFGRGAIILRKHKDALLIPTEAIHWEGDCNIVFVRDKNYFYSDLKVYYVRTVRPGVRQGDNTEIIAGLALDEVVASRNSSALRAQLLKNNLGAG